jgi:hypothetical protein
MKIIGKVEIEATKDVVCDVCLQSTKSEWGNYLYGTLQAHWGFGAKNDGQRYELHLCESCFFGVVANLKQERRVQHLFSDDGGDNVDDFGLIAKDDYFV